MRVIEFSQYGPPDVLRMIDRPRPTAGRREVVIRVVATTVTSAEVGMRRGEPRWGRVILGFTRPRTRMRVLGLEVAGVIESVGREVTRFAPGDHVFGFTGFSLGGNAEFLRLPESESLAIKPRNVTFAEAAGAVDGATTALYFLRDKAAIRSGQRVLVVGASGSIGTYAVQIAKRLGAAVTAVCGPRNAELVTSLGADDVIDYTVEDFTERGEKYDVIFDTVGAASFRRCMAALTPAGVFLPTTGLGNYVLQPWTAITGGRLVITGMSANKSATLPTVATMIESGELTIILDREFPLARIADAHRYVEAGHKRGNVVVRVAPDPETVAGATAAAEIDSRG